MIIIIIVLLLLLIIIIIIILLSLLTIGSCNCDLSRCFSLVEISEFEVDILIYIEELKVPMNWSSDLSNQSSVMYRNLSTSICDLVGVHSLCLLCSVCSGMQ